jgi:hypothetical protein
VRASWLSFSGCSTGTLFLYGIDQRETARAYTASDLGNGTPRSDPHPRAGDSRRSGLRLFGYQFARRPAAAGPPGSVNGQPAPGARASEEQLANGSHR